MTKLYAMIAAMTLSLTAAMPAAAAGCGSMAGDKTAEGEPIIILPEELSS